MKSNSEQNAFLPLSINIFFQMRIKPDIYSPFKKTTGNCIRVKANYSDYERCHFVLVVSFGARICAVVIEQRTTVLVCTSNFNVWPDDIVGRSHTAAHHQGAFEILKNLCDVQFIKKDCPNAVETTGRKTGGYPGT